MMSVKERRNWDGDEIEARMKRAAGRAVVATAYSVMVKAKQNAHVISGNLRRSIHTAPPGYAGADDLLRSATADIAPHSEAVERRGNMVIAVGSWLPYACVEEVGRGHAFMTPALEATLGAEADAFVAAAIKSEGL